MNLALFFTPVDESVISTKENTIGFHAATHNESLPNWKDADIVFFTVPEYRGKEVEEVWSLNTIREQFYQLKNNFESLKVADLGDLKPGPSLEDTYLRICLLYTSDAADD